VVDPQGKPGRPGAPEAGAPEARSFFSNAPADTPKEVLARVAMSRWRAPSGHETEFEEGKSQVALDEYKVRSWAGWHHHVTMCLPASAFLLTLQQDWGKKVPQLTRPQVYRVVYELLPKKHWSAEALLGWLEGTQRRNAAAGRSHAQRRAREHLDRCRHAERRE
jgi:hypothetical protein